MPRPFIIQTNPRTFHQSSSTQIKSLLSPLSTLLNKNHAFNDSSYIHINLTVIVTDHVISKGPVALQIQIKTSKLRLPISEKDNHAVSCPL